MGLHLHDRPEVRAPLQLAEDLDFESVAGHAWQHVMKRSAAGKLASAWHHTEYAINQSGVIDEIGRIESLECARSLTSAILERKHASINTHLGALVLASYLPVFQKRAFDAEITSNDCVDVYSSLASIYAYMKPLQHGEVPSSLSLEILIFALSARTRMPNYLLYPASPREEASNTKDLNHDSYFVKTDRKLPMQQKLIATASEYEPSITMLTLLPLVEKANRKCGYNTDDDVADQLNHAISLIVAEAGGEELDKHEKSLLDVLSQTVVAHYRQALSQNGLRDAA